MNLRKILLALVLIEVLFVADCATTRDRFPISLVNAQTVARILPARPLPPDAILVLPQWDMGSEKQRQTYDPTTWKYRWTSDHTLLFSVESVGNPKQFFHYDRQAASPRLIPYKTEVAHFSKAPDASDFSLDGKFYLSNFDRGSVYSPLFGSDLDGNNGGSWPEGPVYPLWLPDSRHFLAFVLTSQVLPRTVKRIDLYSFVDRHFKKVMNLPAGLKIREETLDDAACLLGNRLALTSVERKGADSHIHLLELSLRARVSILHRYLFRLPKGRRVQDQAFSPRGDRIVWQLRHNSAPRSSAVEIWTSRLNGTEWRRIVTLEDMGEASPFRWVFGGKRFTYFCQWLPDGKRLSYLYKNALYIASAEGSAVAVLQSGAERWASQPQIGSCYRQLAY